MIVKVCMYECLSVCLNVCLSVCNVCLNVCNVCMYAGVCVWMCTCKRFNKMRNCNIHRAVIVIVYGSVLVILCPIVIPVIESFPLNFNGKRFSKISCQKELSQFTSLQFSSLHKSSKGWDGIEADIWLASCGNSNCGGEVR